MGLSRLNNFLKSTRGTILYVNPNDLDSTDSIENLGNSLTRPFKTIQRALIESARFSYQRGLNNDRFGKTTILVYPGDHVIDNRPGWIPDGTLGAGVFLQRNGSATNDFQAFDLTSNFDLNSESNSLYKLNSIHGGVIVPRGTSIVGLDLRKTKIRPKYIPNPTNDQIERTAIFRLTGGCYLWQFSILDSDPNGLCYIDYTTNKFVPNFSHHKLTAFEYVDGTNNVEINDEFIEGRRFGRTDLDMYYEKVGLAYGQASGRTIEPDYPDSEYDIEPKIDEYRIVGSTGLSVGITSIRSGDGIVSGTTVTVTTDEVVSGLDVDTAIRIEGITVEGYDGSFVVTNKLSSNQIQYKVQNEPLDPLPNSAGATLSLEKNTVTSASPYIFNVSLRSVYGMCGIHADGSKASGFKSVIISQFTGIGLQKDDRAFVVFNSKTGLYEDSTNVNLLSSNSLAVYKSNWKNYHIKASNDAFIQCVSVFAIGYAEHFVTDSGGDLSITNSNSNFGSKSLIANGFKSDAFPQDDCGYITHIIPTKEIPDKEITSVEFESIDVSKTETLGSIGYLYLYGFKNSDLSPETVIDGYRLGAAKDEKLRVLVSYGGSVTEYSSRVIMPGSYSGSNNSLYYTSEKSFSVRTIDSDVNSVDGIITFGPSGHSLLLGEKIRFLSESGKIPDGLENNQVYYAITRTGDNDVGIGTTQIKVAKTLGDALSHTSSSKKSLYFNNRGQNLKVVSRVSDKNAGDVGHPVQYDTANSQWYVLVSTASTENGIYNIIQSLSTTYLGEATSRTFIKRKKDTRLSSERLYRLRYVIPKDTASANVKSPTEGFIIQESNSTTGLDNEVTKYFGSGSLNNTSQLRNFKFIADAGWNSNTNIANFITEVPHNLRIGSTIEIVNVQTDINPVGTGNSGFNGLYSITGISSSKHFSVNLASNPGIIVNNTNTRDSSLPYLKRKEYKNTYYIFKSEEVKPFISGIQDGIYYLTVLNASVSPEINFFNQEEYSQPVSNLFPQIDRDNPTSDPEDAKSFAQTSLIGETLVDDPRKSITKETVSKILYDTNVGFGITNIVSTSSTIHTIYTATNHPFNGIVKVSIANSGSQYGNGQGFAQQYYNAKLVGIGTSTTGKHATAKVLINDLGNLSDIIIMDGGSAYGIGNTLSVVGIETYGLAGHTVGVVSVTRVYNNVNEVLRISGVSSDSYQPFNNLYRITGVNVGAANSFQAQSSTPISSFNSTIGIGSLPLSNALVYSAGSSLIVNSLVYNRNVGIATIVTQQSHGLSVDSKVRITGSNQSLYNGDFIVTENVNTTTFKINIGIGTTQPTASGAIYVYREGVSSNNGTITLDNENLNGRMVPIYAGITTSLQFSIDDSISTSITINNIQNLGLKIGDFLMIDDEILRIKDTIPNNVVAGNAINVFRGVLGTKATSHPGNSVVRKINPLPVEFRRHSIARASGHTFEYVGFGPGNYSTAFPSNQNRQLSKQEEILSQSTRRKGGINFYNGMNDRGISYSGNRKLSIVTGEEEIFDTPIQTIVGEDISTLPSINVSNFTEAKIENSIRVSGGENQNVISEFNGPVVFTNRITSTSSRGIEMNSLYLQGDSVISRKYTVGISTPNYAGTPGDIVYDENPSSSGYVGWIYTRENAWYRFGNINISDADNTAIFESLGVNVNSPGTNRFLVNSGTSQFSVTGSGGVGIGTSSNQYKLNVNGNSFVGGGVTISGSLTIGGNVFNSSGIVTAFRFVGDGSQLTNVNATATGWSNITSAGIITTYNTYLSRVGIGTSRPRYNLEVGSASTTVTTLYVNGKSDFRSVVAENIFTGIITATKFNLSDATSTITLGTLNAQSINVGTGGTILTNVGSRIGVGTITPKASFDVAGSIRFNTYNQPILQVSSGSNNYIALDLQSSQNFEITMSRNIEYLFLNNVPLGMSTFTLKITKPSNTTYTIDIDDLRDTGSNAINTYWPGGVLPNISPGTTDIYSFRIFNNNSVEFGNSPYLASNINIYAVVVGQNFSS